MNARTVRFPLQSAACLVAGALAGLALLLPGCASAPPASPPAAGVRAVPAAVPERLTELLVPDFAETKPVPDLALGRTIAEDLAAGMRGAFKGKVTRLAVPPGPGASALDAGYWKAAGAGHVSAAILFGTAGLSERAQKALLEEDLPKDGPFRLEGHGLAERKLFVLSLDLTLIDAATGEVLWKNEFKETRVYTYAGEAAEFALADLLPLLRARIFPLLFGRPPA